MALSPRPLRLSLSPSLSLSIDVAPAQPWNGEDDEPFKTPFKKISGIGRHILSQESDGLTGSPPPASLSSCSKIRTLERETQGKLEFF